MADNVLGSALFLLDNVLKNSFMSNGLKIIDKGGRPLRWTDPQILENEIEGYFRQLQENEPPLFEGLAVFLKVAKDTLYDYAKKDDFSYVIKRTQDRIDATIFRLALTGKIHPTFAIFYAKVRGYSDQQKTTETQQPIIQLIETPRQNNKADE